LFFDGGVAFGGKGLPACLSAPKAPSECGNLLPPWLQLDPWKSPDFEDYDYFQALAQASLRTPKGASRRVVSGVSLVAALPLRVLRALFPVAKILYISASGIQ
jgi:hypothetical protein